MKRVFIIHGWGGSPEKEWLPWLKAELETRGFTVYAPEMPDTDNPKIDNWVPYLEQIVVAPDKDTYFVAHSIGCQAVMRFLEKIDSKIGGVVFVAGFFTLMNLGLNEDAAIAEPWLNTPIDFEKVKKVAGNIIAIFSDDDPDVPKENADAFLQNLEAKIVLQKNKGHFNFITELPIVRDELLEIAK